MGIGTSIVFLAIGAILRFALTVTVSGIKLHTVGDILMMVGALGIVLSLVFWSSWGGPGHRPATSRTVVRDREVY